MAQVYLTENIHQTGIDLLQNAGHQLHFGWCLSEAEKAELWPQIDAILVRTAKIPAEIIEACPQLKVISKHGVGCDNIDVALARDKNIQLAIAAGANMQAVAEHTIMLLLAAAKNLFWMDETVRTDYTKRGQTDAIEVAGRSILIVGYGRIGKIVAHLCRILGMNVRVNDICFTPEMQEIDGFEIAHDLRAGLNVSDVLSLHLPLTDVSENMIDSEMLSCLRPGGIVVNCARGGIVVEQDLADALSSGHLRAAAVDVFSEEPITADNPLHHAPNLILSPHAAAFTHEALEKMAAGAAQNIVDYFEGTLAEEMCYQLGGLSHR